MKSSEWNLDPYPPEGGDSRKLVTLEKDGMVWVGVRAWSGALWINNGERETATVLAWQELPTPAFGDGKINPMSAPTL